MSINRDRHDLLHGIPYDCESPRARAPVADAVDHPASNRIPELVRLGHGQAIGVDVHTDYSGLAIRDHCNFRDFFCFLVPQPGGSWACFQAPCWSEIVYQATPRDPLILAGVVITVALLGLLATWIPAERALQVHPARLLREE